MIIFLFNNIKSQYYVANTQKYCKFFNIDDWQIDQEERQSKRDSSSYLVVGNFGKVMDFLIEKNEMNLFIGLITYSVVICFFFLIAFVSCFFFMIFPWLCMEVKNKQRKRIQILWWTMLICGFFFVGSYILFLVASQKIKNSTNSINCAVSMIPQQIITGTKLSSYEYMGWNGMIDLLENFQIDLKNLGQHSDSYEQILNLSLQQKGIDSINSIINYQSNYQDSVILDGVGEQTKPLTIQELTNTTDLIQQEFIKFTKVCNQTQAGAAIGKTMGLQENIDNFTKKTEDAIQYLKVLKDETQSPLDEISDSIDQLTKYLNSVHIIVLIGGIIIAIFLGLFQTILYYNWYKRQCFKLFVPLKFFLILSGILTLLLAIVGIFALIVSGSISSTCKQVSAVLQSEEPDQILLSAGIELTDNQKLFVKQCIPETKSGLFDTVVNDFTDIQTLLEGETIFQNFRVNLTRSSENSDTIKDIAKVWDYYLTGYYSNFKNVNETVANLNKQIACEEQEIRLNSLNCTSTGFSCQEVENVITPYTPPACVDSKEDSQFYFNNLINYFSENSKLIKEMIDNLQSEKSSTPNTKYKEMRQALFEADNLRSSIRQTLLQTLNDSSKFNTGFSSFSNCKAARNQILNLEYGLCFTSNSSATFYLFSIIFMVLFMIVINASLYFAMKNVEVIDFFQLDNSDISDGSDSSDDDKDV